MPTRHLPTWLAWLALAAASGAGAGCTPYEPACRASPGTTVLPASEPGLDRAMLSTALEPQPGGKVLARWWRPVERTPDGGLVSAGPVAESALFASDGAVLDRASVTVPGAWEGAPGTLPGRLFVQTAAGVGAAVKQLRARVAPDLSVQLRTTLVFMATDLSGTTTTVELPDTSCFDCDVAATLRRLGAGNVLLVAAWPADGSPPSGLVLSFDDEGATRGRLSIASGDPFPLLLPRTRTDALALLSESTLRLWDEQLAPVGPPLGLGAPATAADWDLSERSLVAATYDGDDLFVESFAWTNPARAERHRASSGLGIFTVAQGKNGTGLVLTDGLGEWFAFLDEAGAKRGPDVPLGGDALGQSDDAGLGSLGVVAGPGALVEVPGSPGRFAYFAATTSGLVRREVNCE